MSADLITLLREFGDPPNIYAVVISSLFAYPLVKRFRRAADKRDATARDVLRSIVVASASLVMLVAFFAAVRHVLM